MNAPTSDKSRLYFPKMPATWWLKNIKYFLFMLRELSAVFIAIFLVVLLTQVYSLTHGREAYSAYVRVLASPWWIIFHVVALLFALYHSITWFNLMPQVLVVRLGKRQVPPRLVTIVNFVGWLVVSLAILLLFLFFRAEP